LILVIDNYDSFTYNLVQCLGELATNYPVAKEIKVFRNDQISLADIVGLKPDAIVISPGPGTPDSAGICLDLVAQLGKDYPILGVCLGHQTIGQVFGGKVVSAPVLMHGKTSPIQHANLGVFQDLPNPLTATRYHSLVVEKETIPPVLEITAWTEDDIIMGIRHREFKQIQGVQFHPESILTDSGLKLLGNFLKDLD
jgi:anthranilate synthase component 2